MKDFKNKYVLYDTTDDTLACSLIDGKTMIFNDKKSAQKKWTGYPEQVTNFSKLPIHIKQIIKTDHES